MEENREIVYESFMIIIIRIADIMSAKLSRNLLLCRVVNVSAMQLWSYGLVSTCYTAVINLPAGKCVHTGMS